MLVVLAIAWMCFHAPEYQDTHMTLDDDYGDDHP